MVGLGQAGGNLAAEFHRRGYRALALNTAQTDLAALDPGGVFPALPAARRLYVGLDGYDGAGADPAYGQECLRAHAETIRNAVLEQAEGADVVILAAGLGGGTGSSIPALIELLEGEELPLVALLTLPTDGESGLAKVNAIRAVNQIVSAPLLGWIFADNARIASLQQDVAVSDYFARINAAIAEPIDALNQLNARPELHPIRSFDGEDFRKVLLSTGMLGYGVRTLDNLDSSTVSAVVRGAVESSDLMPGGQPMDRLSYLGVVIEAPSAELERASFAELEGLADQLKRATRGAAIYTGVYRIPADRPLQVRVLSSAPSLPDRMGELLSAAREEGQTLGEKVSARANPMDLGEVSGFDLFPTQSRPSQRPRRRPARPAPAPVRRPAELLEDVADELAALEPELSRPRPRAPVEPPPEPRRSVRNEAPTAEAMVPKAPEPNPPRIPAADSGARPRRPRRRAEAGEAGSGDDRPRPELGTEEIDVGAALADAPQPARLGRSAPPAALESAPTGELPDPATYDALVASFLAAPTPEAQHAIGRRLVDDARSKMTLVRYYAVEAMAKLDHDSFRSALRRASADADPAVRDLARSAVRDG